MTLFHWAVYLVSGIIAGVINAVAGGGSLVLYPTLLGLGLSPILANTTMSLIILPGTVSSAYGYRKHLKKLAKRFYLLLIPCFIGSLLGAIILVKTSNLEFEKIVAYFLALAVLLLLFQSRIHKWLYTSKGIAIRRRHRLLGLVFVSIMFFIVSLYGGYFGAGFGIMILAFLGLTQITDIQRMNGLKNLAGVSVGIADCAYFIAHRLVDWNVLGLFAIGCLLGGYFGSTYSSKLPVKTLRIGIIVIGAIITVVLFYKFNL